MLSLKLSFDFTHPCKNTDCVLLYSFLRRHINSACLLEQRGNLVQSYVGQSPKSLLRQRLSA